MLVVIGFWLLVIVWLIVLKMFFIDFILCGIVMFGCWIVLVMNVVFGRCSIVLCLGVLVRCMFSVLFGNVMLFLLCSWLVVVLMIIGLICLSLCCMLSFSIM